MKSHLSFKLIVTLLVAVSLGSCKKENKAELDDHFFVKNDDATMPVVVRGNLESEVVVIFLHGGPGGNASTVTFLPVFQELENDYAIAYWDQRASGLAQGNPDKSTFTVEQFVEDLDMVVDAISVRYDNPKIFLFGHSWGGALGGAYLSTGSLQDKISGFICMDSGHNLEMGLPLSVDWTENYADSLITLGTDVDYWTEVRDWCQTEPDMTVPDNYFKYVPYLKSTAAYRTGNVEVNTGSVGFNGIFNSFMGLSVFFNGAYVGSNFNILELNLSSQMNSINTPSVVMWGKHDGINTLEMGYDAYNSIGDAFFTEKEMIVFENSAHEPMLEEEEKFKTEFRQFVELYK